MAKKHSHTGDIHGHVGHHLPPHPGKDKHAHKSHHQANKEYGMGNGMYGSGDNDACGKGMTSGGSGDNDSGYTGVKGGIGSPGGAGMASNVKYGS